MIVASSEQMPSRASKVKILVYAIINKRPIRRHGHADATAYADAIRNESRTRPKEKRNEGRVPDMTGGDQERNNHRPAGTAKNKNRWN